MPLELFNVKVKMEKGDNANVKEDKEVKTTRKSKNMNLYWVIV